MYLKSRPQASVPLIEEVEGKDIFSYGNLAVEIYEMKDEDLDKFGIPSVISDKGILYISDTKTQVYYKNIPEKFLSYALINEVLCPEVLKRKGACKETLKEEISVVPSSIRDEYINWRIAFYKAQEQLNLFFLGKSGEYRVVEFGESELDDAGFDKNKTDDERYADEMKSCYQYLELKNLKVFSKISEIIYDTFGTAFAPTSIKHYESKELKQVSIISQPGHLGEEEILASDADSIIRFLEKMQQEYFSVLEVITKKRISKPEAWGRKAAFEELYKKQLSEKGLERLEHLFQERLDNMLENIDICTDNFLSETKDLDEVFKNNLFYMVESKIKKMLAICKKKG